MQRRIATDNSYIDGTRLHRMHTLKATDTRRGNMPQMLTRRATTAVFRTQSDRHDLTTNINNQRSQAHAPDSSSYIHNCLMCFSDGRTTATVGEWKQKRRAKI